MEQAQRVAVNQPSISVADATGAVDQHSSLQPHLKKIKEEAKEQLKVHHNQDIDLIIDSEIKMQKELAAKE